MGFLETATGREKKPLFARGESCQDGLVVVSTATLIWMEAYDNIA